MVTKKYQLAPQISPLRNIHPLIEKGTLFIISSFTFARLKLMNYQNVHKGGRACARSDQRRVRSSTASKMSDSVESTRWCGRPFPDIVKQVVFKIEKLTKRVHRPKAPAALPQPKLCHLLARRRRAQREHVPGRARCRVNGFYYLPHILLTNTQQHLQTTQKIFSIEAAYDQPQKGSFGNEQLPNYFCFYIQQQ